jgi:spore maturation protein B
MEIFSIIILPIIVLSIIIYGYKKKINIYDSFLKGVIEGLKTCLTVFPNLLAMVFAVNILISSGIIETVFSFLNNFLNAFSLSTDILSMSLIRPISGTASLAIMNNIFEVFTPDSIMGRLASTIQGSTDTTFYVLALYFGSIGVKKTRYALSVGLFADLVGIIMAFVLVYLFF